MDYETEKEIEETMEEQNSWTSITLYYRGVHVKKSVPKNVSLENLKKTIDSYLDAGFLPSWNTDTNKQANPVSESPSKPSVVCETCNQPAELRKGLKKDNTEWQGIFCKSGNRDHTKFIK